MATCRAEIVGNIARSGLSADLYLPRSADSLRLLNKRFEYQKELPVSADFGANDWLVEEMYERYQADPTSVEPSWIEFFKTYNPAAGTAAPATIAAKSDAPKAGTPPIPKATSQVLTPAPSTLAAPVTSAPVSTPASVDDQINTNDYSVTDPVIEKCSFQRNTICLPPDIAFQVHLLSQMNTHRGNDLNMFNEVI